MRVISEDIPGDPRIATSRAQLWHAIAGHGIDRSKIKPAEFLLLHIIAKHGADGIAQPELVRVSQQDKRSVPQRTDRLAAGGYISKVSVIARGAKTSLLTLKKFATNTASTRELVHYEVWFKEVLRLLRENNNIVAAEDIRIELGIAGQRVLVRALQRCLIRLAAAGCIRRVQAQVADKQGGQTNRKITPTAGAKANRS